MRSGTTINRRFSGDIMNKEDVIGYEALWESMLKCKNGVLWKDSVAGYFLNGIAETARLEQQLHDGTYHERPHKYFTITYPKERDIMSISFRDRVYQRSLNDVAIYPAISKSFIYDNCACQKHKSADFARNRWKCHLQRFWRKHGMNGYCLKMDIRGYYPDMRHDVAKAVFGKYLEPWVYNRAAEILDGFPGDVGFNPGSQIIQIAGISVLSGIDHFIKERLRVKQYIRYMDDMVLLTETKEEAERIKVVVVKKLKDIGYELHSRKTTITPLSKPIMFLGFEYRLTETGKVIMTLDSKRVKAERKKLYRMIQKVKRGSLSWTKADESYGCWRNHAGNGNSFSLLRHMDTYYQELWGDTGAEGSKENVAP